MPHRRLATELVLGLAAALCATAWPARAADDPSDLYLREVKPLLAARCGQCHGPDEQESGLRLDTAQAALAGGISGPAVVAGKSGESRLILAVSGGTDELSAMPPEGEGEPFSAAEVELLKRWIDAGAAAPADETPAEPRARPRPWSFEPLVRPAPPPVRDVSWPRGAIDAFVLAELEARGLAPSPEAERAVLLRRLSLDLLGLPPTPEEIDAFSADPRPDAYEREVDRLLASPRFGERWGRHWLDAARYADSDGYTNDPARLIWKYRDWVLEALNRDLPFDQFAIEQLAGDMLPSATLAQRIATGFHRNTQINREGGTDAEQYRVEAVVDRVATTGLVFLGLTLGCARCHDHKFDPISQAEFYQLFAVFNAQDEPTIEVPAAGEELPFELLAARGELANAQQRLRAYDLSQTEKQAAWEERMRLALSAPPVPPAEGAAPAEPPLPDPVQAALRKPAAERTPAEQQAVTAEFQNRDPERQRLTGMVQAAQQRETDLKAGAATTTLVMQERRQPRPTHILIRGEYLRNGKLVEPGAPAALPPVPAGGERINRLDLARWLVSPEQPLTPRVTANRVWQRLFGAGLVPTDNDFGSQGARPSHPALLDYLAAEFRRAWSLKGLIREIVLSAAYRQASHERPDLADVDPDNRLWARQNRVRLEAEAIRDAALAASGLLSTKCGGPSVFPPQPEGVMRLTQDAGRKWVVSPGEDRYRRGLYTHVWRQSPHPFLKVFDAPESSTSCTRRDRSNTPVQALTLLNDEAFVEAALALAVRVLRTPGSDAERLARAFRWCLGRAPEAAELAALTELLAAERAAPAGAALPAYPGAAGRPADVDAREFAAWGTVGRTLLNVDEFITRE